jgi:hypothetical protein
VFNLKAPGTKNREPCIVAVALAAAAVCARAALPAGWTSEDIGSPALAGSASYTNGLWTVAGGGADIWGASDQFNFCSNSLTGDGMIIARVLSQSGTDAFAQTGVMIRNAVSLFVIALLPADQPPNQSPPASPRQSGSGLAGPPTPLPPLTVPTASVGRSLVRLKSFQWAASPGQDWP